MNMFSIYTYASTAMKRTNTFPPLGFVSFCGQAWGRKNGNAYHKVYANLQINWYGFVSGDQYTSSLEQIQNTVAFITMQYPPITLGSSEQELGNSLRFYLCLWMNSWKVVTFIGAPNLQM